MNTKALVFAVTAACLTSGAAFAQSYDYRNGGYERGNQYQRNTQDGRYDRNGDGRVDGRYDRNRDGRVDRDYRESRDYRNDSQRDYNNRVGDGRHYSQYTPAQTYGYNNGYNNGARYQFRRGEYLNSQYRDRRYVVSDWRSRNLYQPQYGYQWVQSGNDYAMVAIATGLIAAVLLNH